MNWNEAQKFNEMLGKLSKMADRMVEQNGGSKMFYFQFLNDAYLAGMEYGGQLARGDQDGKSST